MIRMNPLQIFDKGYCFITREGTRDCSIERQHVMEVNCYDNYATNITKRCEKIS